MACLYSRLVDIDVNYSGVKRGELQVCALLYKIAQSFNP